MPTLSDDWPATDSALASFAEDLRILAGGPAPEPRPGVVAVMRGGVVETVRTSPGRRRMLVKTVVGSLAAKIALGMGVAAASVTAAGAAGVLPDPAQRAVASVVGAATPFALPDPSGDPLQVVSDGTTTTTSSTSTTVAGTRTSTTLPGTVTTLPGTGTGAVDGEGDEFENHGACVSAAAQGRSGSGSHGKTVSSVARSDCGKAATTSPTTSTSLPGSTTTTPTTVGSTQRSTNSGPGGVNSGQGNNGNGNGNSGPGNGNIGPGNGNSGRG